MGDFVTDAQVFVNTQRLKAGVGTQSASVTAAVLEAEQWINSELAESLGGATIPVLPGTPNAIQLIALWESTSLALAKVFGGEGKEDTNPVSYWHNKAVLKLNQILGGHIRLDFNGTNVGPAAQDFDTNKEPEDTPGGARPVEPYLGYGQGGERIEDSAGVEQRAPIDYDEGAPN